MYRTILVVLVSLCIASTALAQAPSNGVTLFGKVQDAQTKAGVPYLTLQLLTEKDSGFVGGRLLAATVFRQGSDAFRVLHDAGAARRFLGQQGCGAAFRRNLMLARQERKARIRCTATLELGALSAGIAQKPSDADMRITESMRGCACFLCVKKSGETIGGGTAFLVSLPSSEFPALSWTYLVTAKHNVQKAIHDYGTLYARFNTAQGKADLVELNAPWIFSEKHGSDVAVMEFSPDRKRFLFSTMSTASAVDPLVMRANNIGIGSDLLVIGLFKEREGVQKNIPILRSGMIAAMPEEPLIDNMTGARYDAYLAEIRSASGLSGSPVFVHVPEVVLQKDLRRPHQNGYLFLLGLVRGHFNLQAPGFPAADPINTGIAIITPMPDVMEVLIQNEELASRRALEVQRYIAKRAPSSGDGFQA